jgi:hypothetical protein
MRLNGNLVLNSDASGEIQHAYIERLAAAPTFDALQKGRIYFNTNSSLYYYNDGAAWAPFATGGNAAALQSEVDAIEASLGGLVNADGTYVAGALTGSLAGTASLTDAIQKLQALADANASAISAEVADRQAAITAEETARTEADTAEATARAAADQTLTDNLAAEVTRATDAEAALGTRVDGVDADLTAEVTRATSAEAALGTRVDGVAADLAQEVTDRETADTNLQLAVDGKVSKAGDTMSGQLAMGGNKIIGVGAPTQADDAVNKNYVDSLLSGLTWEAPVDEIVADATAVDLTGKADGYRIVDTTAKKIFTVAGGALDAGEDLVEGAALFHKGDEQGFVFNGTDLVQFTGTGQIAAGIGLVKVGNQLDVNLGAGIAQLPTDEVGVDVLGTGGLFLTIDGVTPSTDSASQLSVKLDGDTLTRGENGLKVSNAVIQSISDAAGAAATEQTRAEAAEGALGTRIDGVEGDLAQEVTDRTAADTALDGKIATETSDRQAADTTLQGNIDATNVRIGKMYFLYEAGAAATVHTVTHNLGQKYCNVTIVDDTDNVVIPQSIVFDSDNQLTVSFTSALQCKAIVMGLAVVA